MRPHINFTRELLASSARVRDNIGVFSIKIIGRSQRTSRAYQIVRPILSVGTSVRFLKDSFDRIVLSQSDYQLSSRRPSPCSVRKILPQLATFFYVRRHEEVVCRGTHIQYLPSSYGRFRLSAIRRARFFRARAKCAGTLIPPFLLNYCNRSNSYVESTQAWYKEIILKYFRFRIPILLATSSSSKYKI